MAARITVLVLALLAVASTANAANKIGDDERDFTSIWLIQRTDDVLGPRTVEPGTYVLKQNLLPPTLIRLSDDAVGGMSGKVLVPKGNQLFGLLTKGPPIFCVVGIRDPSFGRSLLVGSGNRQQCLVDMDRDGRLDSFFTAGNQIRGLPNIAGRRPTTVQQVRPTAYEQLSREQLATRYFVGLLYFGNGSGHAPPGTLTDLSRSLLHKAPVFKIVFGNDESSDALTQPVAPTSEGDRVVVRALGSEFAITGRNRKAIDVDIVQAMPPQAFGVERTVSFQKY